MKSSAVAKKPRAPKLTWHSVCRQPTGMHPMDSGGANRRHWQRPLPSASIKLERSGGEILAYVSLPAFLETHFEIDSKLTNWLRRESDKQSRHGYSEYADLLAEKLGLTHLSGDYTYNWENDLSQNFQFTIVGPAGADWIYSDDCYLIIETHNGADARGGFSDPVVCKPIDPGSWLDVVAGISFSEGTDATGAQLDSDELQQLDEELQVGYSSYPTGRFSDSIAEIISVSENKNEFTVRLTTGETVTGYFYFRDSNGGYET